MGSTHCKYLSLTMDKKENTNYSENGVVSELNLEGAKLKILTMKKML